MLLLAAGIAGDAARSAAPAADMPARAQLGPSAVPAGSTRAAATMSAPAIATKPAAPKPAPTKSAATPPAAAPRPAAADQAWATAVDHARAARARFNEARNALERALLSDGAPKADVVVLEAAMKDVNENLALLAAMAQPPATDAILKAMRLAQDWYQAGLKIVSPPAEGVTELPLPMSLRSKGDAVAAALDQVAKQTIVHAPPPQSTGSVQKRASVAPRSVASDAHPVVSAAPAGPSILPE
jgi:hypothetical protein